MSRVSPKLHFFLLELSDCNVDFVSTLKNKLCLKGLIIFLNEFKDVVLYEDYFGVLFLCYFSSITTFRDFSIFLSFFGRYHHRFVILFSRKKWKRMILAYYLGFSLFHIGSLISWFVLYTNKYDKTICIQQELVRLFMHMSI